MSDWKGRHARGVVLGRFQPAMGAPHARWQRGRAAGHRRPGRGSPGAFDAVAARLHGLAHQVAWLNPLLCFDGFEPRAAGMGALLPHVDRFLRTHNLASWPISGAHWVRRCAPVFLPGV